MFGKASIKRITAILLTVMMVFTVPGFAEAADAAQENSAYSDEYAAENASEADMTDTSADDTNGDPADPAPSDLNAEENTETEDAADAADNTDDSADSVQLEAAEAAQGEETPAPSEEEALQEIKIYAAGEDGSITVVWSAVAGAEYYIVRLDNNAAGTKVTVSGGTALRTVIKASTGAAHSITVEAYRSRTEAEGGDLIIGKGKLDNIRPSARSRITKKTASALGLGINLRKMLGEPYNGYAVVQGGCTDGTYAYSLLVSSGNQKGRILKSRVGTGTVVAKSKVINICHGNGMTLNTKDRKLVIVGRESRRNQLTIVNADNLSDVSYVNVNYSNSGYWNKTKGNGLSCISYIPKYDCYVALQRKTHELLILDKYFRVIGQAGTKITAKYPGVYQAMDADERYVYLLLSYHSSRQPYNIVLVLDWNSENLLDVANGSKSYINKRWLCNNNGSGEPDTVIRINTPHEAENIYHIEQGNGTSKFYLSEYYNNPKYKKVKKTKTVKVKWKKVKKKVKVKWKRVKKNGKWKWKYKYKWKKVWKYKKKKKKVKVKVFQYFNRAGYVYDLGTF